VPSGDGAGAASPGADPPGEPVDAWPLEEPFALCLTHDVDRVRKTYQTVYYAVRERDPSHLRALLPGRNPYWQFEDVMALEDDLGVRSAFYFLDEQSLAERPPREWLSPEAWKLYAARYDVTEPRVAEVVGRLDRGGWEVGLHGSYDSYRDRELLAREKRTVERVLGHEVTGGRQHYLNLEIPGTWRRQAAVGLRYDASPGSSTTYGFHRGYRPFRPFGDGFVVFPLTVMEVALPDPDPASGPSGGGVSEAAMAACDELLAEARDHGAVMTALWHPRYFSTDFPGYRACYRYLVERALELGAWVGPPGDLYPQLPDSGPATGDRAGTVPAVWAPDDGVTPE
jgi:hypothetical protein